MFRRSTNEYIGIPVNADIMTRNTFKQIFCFLHLADNTYDLAGGQIWLLIIGEVSYIVKDMYTGYCEERIWSQHVWWTKPERNQYVTFLCNNQIQLALEHN